MSKSKLHVMSKDIPESNVEKHTVRNDKRHKYVVKNRYTVDIPVCHEKGLLYVMRNNIPVCNVM